MDTLAAAQDPIIKMNYSNAQEHVSRTERNNSTIRERVRASYYQIPYKNLPRILVKYMISEAARKLNYFSAKHSISQHYSPRMIVHKENIYFDKHCKFVHRYYVQAHDEQLITNNNVPRSLDCLYLCPTTSHQGEHEELHLQTNHVINIWALTPTEITPSIIMQVHTIAKADKIPDDLKIENRDNLILFDSFLIAGVDYGEELFRNQDPKLLTDYDKHQDSN